MQLHPAIQVAHKDRNKHDAKNCGAGNTLNSAGVSLSGAYWFSVVLRSSKSALSSFQASLFVFTTRARVGGRRGWGGFSVCSHVAAEFSICSAFGFFLDSISANFFLLLA
jgi:hypothetical protein